MRYLILFLILAVSAGCAKVLSLDERRAMAHNICDKRALEYPSLAYTECIISESERLRKEYGGTCPNDNNEPFYDCYDFLIDP